MAAPKTPSKHTPIKYLKQIKKDNFIGKDGTEYNAEEVLELIQLKEAREAHKVCDFLDRQQWHYRLHLQRVKLWEKQIGKLKRKIKKDRERFKAANYAVDGDIRGI